MSIRGRLHVLSIGSLRILQVTIQDGKVKTPDGFSLCKIHGMMYLIPTAQLPAVLNQKSARGHVNVSLFFSVWLFVLSHQCLLTGTYNHISDWYPFFFFLSCYNRRPLMTEYGKPDRRWEHGQLIV